MSFHLRQSGCNQKERHHHKHESPLQLIRWQYGILQQTLCASSSLRDELESQVSQSQERPAQELIDHHTDTMGSEFSSDSGHGPPSAFGIMFGQVQLLLQLGIDRFADETEAVELFLCLGRTLRLLVDLGWSEQLHRAILLKEALECSVIVGTIPK